MGNSETINKRRKKFFFPILLVIVDALIIEVSILLAYWIRFNLPIIPVVKGIPPFSIYLNSSIYVLFIFLLSLHFFKLYRTKRGFSQIDELFAIFKAISLGIVIVMATTFLYRDESYSRIVLFEIWIISFFLLCITRTLMRRLEMYLHSKGYGVKRVAIVGTGEISKKITENISKRPGLGYDVIGIIEEARTKNQESKNNLKTIGTIDNIKSIIENHQIDLIIVTTFYECDKSADNTDVKKYRDSTLFDILDISSSMNVEVQWVPDFYEAMITKVKVGDIGGIPVLRLKESPLDGWGGVFKRVFDIVLSTIGLVIISPILVVIGILVKLTSPGPVFYKQKRVGLDGKEFIMYKFRSMKVATEESEVPGWTKKDDPRRTAFGAFIRKLSLDELPQLLNVIKGEMSLVGPRPEQPYYVNQFKSHIPRYFERHKVKSGITGWAQINGLRGDTSIEERTRYDLYYVENWSFWFDIKILILTLFRAWKDESAY